ncbi:MAG: hypothetical protein NVSMB1_09000 [Polyangiales bacterium]
MTFVVIGLLTIGSAACTKSQAGEQLVGQSTAGESGPAKTASAKAGEPAKEPTKEVEAMVPLDVSATKLKGFKINAPPGAATALEAGTEDLQIIKGDHFAYTISFAKTDIGHLKKSNAENDINVLKRYLTDTPDVIVYESSVMGPEFHFAANIKVAGKFFSCEDVKGATFTQSDVEQMLASCKSLSK